jgi:hypothetical protein
VRPLDHSCDLASVATCRVELRDIDLTCHARLAFVPDLGLERDTRPSPVVRSGMQKLGTLAFVLLAACGGSKAQQPTEPVAPMASEPAQPTTPTESTQEAPAPAASSAPPLVQPAMSAKDVGLATPESVAYDPVDDTYLVANINGAPSDKDGNGFISKLSPDGKVIALTFIDGAKKGTKLDAPKGMAISKDVLYVTDIDTVRTFDRKTGKSKGDIALKGATFLNDISVGPDGKVYVSDTGVKIDANGFTDTKTDAIWVIQNKKATQLAKGAELGKPNGVVATADGVWVNTFGTGEIYLIDAKGARSHVQKLPAGQLDGLLVDGDTIWTSSWEGSGIYRGTAGGEFKLVFGSLKAPADIGFDSKRKLVLVPMFQDNAVLTFGM